MSKHKLSASALSLYLRSPRAYYWRYITKLDPVVQSVATFDHDKICGILWAEFVDRFYKGVGEAENTDKLFQDWQEQTQGWVPPKVSERLTTALQAWATAYYQMFNPTDGCRNGSEKLVENDRFVGYLDGLSHDLIIHECKTTSRAPQLSEQLLRVQSSIQIKLYAVMTKANGVVIEFSFKDSPYQVFRAPMLPITQQQREHWEQELNALADSIYALGTDEHNFPCHPDGCTIISKNFVGLCPYQSLCLDGLTEVTAIAFKTKEHRK